MARSPSRSTFALLAALVAGLLASGCAGLPRIDPSGRQILIWPDRQTAAPALPGVPTLGNIDVPPVFAGQTPTVPPPGDPLAAPVLGATPVIVQPGQPGAPRAEQLSITPRRLLAPVGSEVILKAGVCGPNDYLRTNRRIEWMLGQEGSGQFVTVGERGEMDLLRCPWERPNKIDNSYAVGYTSPFHTCLRRGTPDSTDDVQVRPGEAWITVSSASEGVSYVTATAPESGNWDARRATATIYWVDAQWRLPPPQALQPGQTGTLTTTVTRQTDGAPLAGWIVRYEVRDDATARLGYESGAVTEATTDAQGRASVQVTPTDDGPGSVQVQATVIRPANSAPMPSPRLELGGGETTVTWSPTAVPPVVVPGTTPPDQGPSPQPPAPQPPAPFEPPPRDEPDPIAPPVAGVGPQIELVLRRDTDGPIRVGDSIPVTVTLINTGDAPAERLRIVDEFDRGLSSPNDLQGLFRMERPERPDLGPGESLPVELLLTAAAPGRQCHRVTVSAEGMATAFEQQCFEVMSVAPAGRPELRIETDLDAVREEGEVLTYVATVYNDGPAAATDVRVEVLNDPQLEVEQATPGFQTILNTTGATEVVEGVYWNVPRIEPGGSYRLEVEYRCLTATDQARMTTWAYLNDSDFVEKTDGVEVRRAAGGGAQPGGGFGRPALEGVLSSNANPARVGQPATLNLTITNTTAAAIDNVQYRVVFPAQITPSVALLPASLGARQNGTALEFAPLPRLEPGGTFELAIPYTPTQQALAEVLLQIREGASGVVSEARTTVSIGPR